MTDDARETARRVLEAAMNHGDPEAAVAIISEALAAAVEGEREGAIIRANKALEDAWMEDLGLIHLTKAIAAAIREEPQP